VESKTGRTACCASKREDVLTPEASEERKILRHNTVAAYDPSKRRVLA